MIGPVALQGLVQNAGKKAEVYLDCEMGHGLDNDDPGFQSEFGTELTNQHDVLIYMVQRSATFFQSILTNTAINGPSIFTECENYRNSCQSSGINNDGCSNNDNPCLE